MGFLKVGACNDKAQMILNKLFLMFYPAVTLCTNKLNE